MFLHQGTNEGSEKLGLKSDVETPSFTLKHFNLGKASKKK